MAPPMIDSGAFSAATEAKTFGPVLLDDYAGYLRETSWHCGYLTLDVIGDPERTWENTERLWAMGLRPIVVVHMGAPDTEYWLRKYAKHPNVRTIALGGLVVKRGGLKRKRQFMDFAWRVLMDYWPIRVHCLGITHRWALDRYPWRSVDSTAWLLGGAHLLTFDRDSGRPLGKVEMLERGEMVRDHEFAAAYHRWTRRGQSTYAFKGLNARYFVRMEREMTERWRARGVVWKGDRLSVPPGSRT